MLTFTYVISLKYNRVWVWLPIFHVARHAIYASACSTSATLLPPSVFEFEPPGITLEQMRLDARLSFLSVSCSKFVRILCIAMGPPLQFSPTGSRLSNSLDDRSALRRMLLHFGPWNSHGWKPLAFPWLEEWIFAPKAPAL